MIVNAKMVKFYNSKIIDILESENRLISYSDRWCHLKPFRDEFSMFVNGYSQNDYNCLSSKVTLLDNGHIIDHHAIGYFSPMNFMRYGFCDSKTKPTKITPVEHLNILNKYLRNYDIRLIYVPLPCKVAVNPSLFVSKHVIPSDNMVIPQWRNMILNLAKFDVEIVDCYSSLCLAKDCYSRNHHISPIGASVIGKNVAEYIKTTTTYDNLGFFYKIDDTIGSPVLIRSGDSNSTEVAIDLYNSHKFYFENNGCKSPYTGIGVKSKIAIIGDCNLQSYRGSGFDITAQISGFLNYPVKYLGRYLPFAKFDSIDKLPVASLANVKILIYVGFISACFVRAANINDCWSTSLPQHYCFE